MFSAVTVARYIGVYRILVCMIVLWSMYAELQSDETSETALLIGINLRQFDMPVYNESLPLDQRCSIRNATKIGWTIEEKNQHREEFMILAVYGITASLLLICGTSGERPIIGALPWFLFELFLLFVQFIGLHSYIVFRECTPVDQDIVILGLFNIGLSLAIITTGYYALEQWHFKRYDVGLNVPDRTTYQILL